MIIAFLHLAALVAMTFLFVVFSEFLHPSFAALPLAIQTCFLMLEIFLLKLTVRRLGRSNVIGWRGLFRGDGILGSTSTIRKFLAHSDMNRDNSARFHSSPSFLSSAERGHSSGCVP
jgi:hypothetical protein